MGTAAPLHIYTPAYFSNPYPVLDQLRQVGPVVQVLNHTSLPTWLVLNYEDALPAIKDERFSKQPIEGEIWETIINMPPWARKTIFPLVKPLFARLLNPVFDNLLNLDNPEHKRLHGLIHKAFSPQIINSLQGKVKTIVDSLLDQAQARGEMEFISEFAYPLPIQVISEMLGVPEADQAQYKAWAATLFDTSVSPIKFMRDLSQQRKYVRQLTRTKRAHPQDDLLSAMLLAEDNGNTMNEDEIVSMASLLLVAGHETTVNLLGNGLALLLRFPDEMTALQQNPDLVKSAVEEFLRFDPPVHVAPDRWAKEDITIAGVTIHKGEMMNVGIGAANHDAAQFEDPHMLNIRRPNNRHLAFGQGTHYCLGAPLARVEANYAFNALLERFPNLQLRQPSEALPWRTNPFFRSLKTLHIKL